jgi:ADP-ribose pyrophosphatase YjhB (NUDIX family)
MHAIDKVLAYITWGNRLLVFRHPDAPEAGIQVPGGTVREGERPEDAAVREAFEETGLGDLRLASCVGVFDQSLPERGETWRRHIYHLVCEDQPPSHWRHEETDPADGSPGPIAFEFFWVELPDQVPPLACGHDRLLPELTALVARSQTRKRAPAE